MFAFQIICAVLLVLCISLLHYIWRMKQQLRNIKKELEATRDKSYNRQVSLELFDKDLSDMAVQLNKNLDYQKQLKLETNKAEKSIRQSVADIAHDLRTPLTVMKGNLQMLKMEEALSEKAQQYLDICVQKTDEMRGMADDFFQLSVLESDLEAVNLRRVDMTEQLLQFLITQEAVIRTKGLEPRVHFPEKSIFVLADEQLLVRIFGNLLNNVMRHAKGESFRIMLEESEKGECIITFANELDGAENLDVDALFERTYRGNRARSGNGAGLGLYIVKLLAVKQKGRVSAQIKENTLYLSVIFEVAK